jgi:hypothetical protein
MQATIKQSAHRGQYNTTGVHHPPTRPQQLAGLGAVAWGACGPADIHKKASVDASSRCQQRGAATPKLRGATLPAPCQSITSTAAPDGVGRSVLALCSVATVERAPCLQPACGRGGCACPSLCSGATVDARPAVVAARTGRALARPLWSGSCRAMAAGEALGGRAAWQLLQSRWRRRRRLFQAGSSIDVPLPALVRPGARAPGAEFTPGTRGQAATLS